jgi:hypothetical protein
LAENVVAAAGSTVLRKEHLQNHFTISQVCLYGLVLQGAARGFPQPEIRGISKNFLLLVVRTGNFLYL